MVIYDLKCVLDHRFEGWFPSAEAFEKQLREGLVQCSVCGVSKVERVPSGGHVVSNQPSPKESLPSPKPSLSPIDQMTTNVDPVVLMKAVRQYVQKNFKNVGDKFTQRAIAIHRGEEAAESIYGTADDKQQDRLDEEGVSVTHLPKLPDEFEN